MRQPGGAEAVALARDDRGIGVRERRVDRRVQPPSTATAPPRSASSSALDVGPGRSARGARTGVPIGGAGRGVRVAPERDHRATDGVLATGVQRLDGATSGVDAIDDDGGERLAGRGLDRGLPAGIDLDEVEQRADHAVDVGESLGAGAGARLVERERQRLGPSRPRVAVAVGGAERRLGVGDLLLGGGSLLLGGRQPLDERAPRRPRRPPPRPAAGSASASRRASFSSRVVRPAVARLELLRAPFDAGAQRRQLAAALRRRGR